MLPDKPLRRMTLRQLMTHAEKCSRDLLVLSQSNLLPRLMEFRDLSRPVRRRSSYPTLLAVQNALKKLLETFHETEEMADYLVEHLDAIHEHASRERSQRL